MANRRTNDASSNNANPNTSYSFGFSSMSTLASAAHAHGQQSQAQPPTSNLSELDLYNMLSDPNTVNYGQLDDTNGIAGFNDWYGGSSTNGFPDMLEGFGTPQIAQAQIHDRGNIIQSQAQPRPSEAIRNSIETRTGSTPQKIGHGHESKPSFQESSKATASPTPYSASASPAPKTKADFRPKVSIPSNLSPEEYARQCILAATSSRLNPFALHPDEYVQLTDHITRPQVTSYLNIRNGILRLWKRNPLISVSRDEAAGCAKDYRWFDLADFAYDWLVRRGYINFGCVDIPRVSVLTAPAVKKRKMIAIIGAGMSGLGCARQLEGLFTTYAERWHKNGEEVPQVIVLEGRGRIGGRVYSHPLRNQVSEKLPPNLRSTADLGGSIITGFDSGNPLSFIIRGQLALQYHILKDNSVLYDVDGTAVDKDQDRRVEQLFNDILDRASTFRIKSASKSTAEGDRDLIEGGRDPAGDGQKMLSDPTNAEAPQGIDNVMAAGVDKLTGKMHIEHVALARSTATAAAQEMGWYIREGISPDHNISLDEAATEPDTNLGVVMSSAIKQYQEIIELSTKDLRLLNWHFANLEYANATNVSTLSLGSWDQDAGNEFEGEHASIVGGYQQVPRGIWSYPSKLDVRSREVVTKVFYSADESGTSARIETAAGNAIEANEVVITVPLGVLKHQSISFDPPLPDWKSAAIQRLGFGVLNKVVLIFEKCFWDADSDMFGVLRESETPESFNQDDYGVRRGRFYFYWNCLKTSGQPMLTALMAGDAAYAAENMKDDELIDEATAILRSIFGESAVPKPTETIVTRWGKDKFARGSYSYVAADAGAEDYDLMAKPVGNLHFAGEATCGTHPATVHGAYLSGLRAASDVVEKLIGPIEIPTPLVPSKAKFDLPVTTGLKRKADDSALQRARDLRDARLEAYEAELREALYEKLGERPTKPGRSGANPFLLYQRDKWAYCKKMCDEARQKATGKADAKATRNEVRAALGQMWRDAPAEEKQPYLDETANNKQQNSISAAEFKQKVDEWDAAAEKFDREYREQHPSMPSEEEARLQVEAEVELKTTRKTRKVGGYAESSESEFDE